MSWTTIVLIFYLKLPNLNNRLLNALLQYPQRIMLNYLFIRFHNWHFLTTILKSENFNISFHNGTICCFKNISYWLNTF